MFRSRSVNVLTLLVALLLMGGFVFFKKTDHLEGDLNKNRGEAKRHVIDKQQTLSSSGITDEKISLLESNDLLEISEDSNVDLVEKKLLDALQELEASRIQLLGEQKRDTKTGTQTWFLIGIEKPDQNQIEMARRLIAEAMRKIESSSRDELDKRIGSVVEMHNSLGAYGDRAAIIMIPDDPEQQMIAYVYRSNDFGAELSKIDPGNVFDYTFSDLKIYFRDDAGSLMRFSKIIK